MKLTHAMQDVLSDLLGFRRGNVAMKGGHGRYPKFSNRHRAAQELQRIGLVEISMGDGCIDVFPAYREGKTVEGG